MNNRKITALFFNLVLALALAITTLPAQAAVPGTLNYQGQLANAAGVPVNGAVNMTFKLYDVSTGGAALWSETQSVTVSNGLYSVTLGQATPLTSSLLGAPRYLGIKVASDAEMTPRIAMSSSATALRAGVADTAETATTATNADHATLADAATTATTATTANALAPTATVAGSQVTGSIPASQISGLPTMSAGTGLALTGNTLSLATGGVATAHIADGAITAAQLAPGAVTTSWTDGAGKVTAAVNVGVGTTTPSATLHVVGSMKIPGHNVQTATSTSNTLLGVGAGNTWMTGTYNTASGTLALNFNTTGGSNTASGAGALGSNTTGTYNTASGESALYSNTTGGYNTASGRLALMSNTTGTYNTASGESALYSNTTGGANTASGDHALYSNTMGTYNTASGTYALYSNTTGYNNTASGKGALRSNTTGISNTASGSSALFINTTGSYNIALGQGAGFDLTTGDNNIDIGNVGVAAEANTIRIGYAQTRTFIAGIRGVTTGVGSAIPVVIDSSGQLGTVSSSRRFKDDIADMSEASSLLMKLRPVTFTYKADKSPERALQYGLIAEEVAAIAPRLVAHSADGQIETVFYQFLTPMLLNEYQKQQRTIEMQTAALARQTARIAELEQAQKDEIAALKEENARQKERVARMESQVQLLLTQAQAGGKLASR